MVGSMETIVDNRLWVYQGRMRLRERENSTEK
jgi:hypothetical protein